MRYFECRHCRQPVFFENTHCEGCTRALGYLSRESQMVTLAPTINADTWTVEAGGPQRWRYCANRSDIACNWLVPADSAATLCEACSLNRTIPNLRHAHNRTRWWKLESAKRRLVYGLLRLGLPLVSKRQDPHQGLAFDFLEDAPPGASGDKIFTGHAGGVITINIIEADDVEREQARKQLAEPYRTLLGHFRHESGHYYWDVLINDSPWLEPFRELFGDERADYGDAMQRYYEERRGRRWEGAYVSAYASAHPWEDWAETWAHYLHMVDALETANAFGIQADAGNAGTVMPAQSEALPYRMGNFDALLRAWVPLTVAINSLNRSMGHGDFYPFVLPLSTRQKLAFVHRVIGQQAAPQSQLPPASAMDDANGRSREERPSEKP